jgi:hypothetical protein
MIDFMDFNCNTLIEIFRNISSTVGLKLDRKHQLLAYADVMNLLGDNMVFVKENNVLVRKLV